MVFRAVIVTFYQLAPGRPPPTKRLTSQDKCAILFLLVFLASDVSSILTCITVIAPLLFLGLLRFISVLLQKNSESVISENKGVRMLKKTQYHVKSCAVSYVACFLETVWAAMVAVWVTATSLGQDNLALAKNISSHRKLSASILIGYCANTRISC